MSMCKIRRIWLTRDEYYPTFESVDGDHDLSAGVALCEMEYRLGRVAQAIAPIDDRPHLPGLEQPGQGDQVFLFRGRHEERHALTPEPGSHRPDHRAAHLAAHIPAVGPAAARHDDDPSRV